MGFQSFRETTSSDCEFFWKERSYCSENSVLATIDTAVVYDLELARFAVIGDPLQPGVIHRGLETRKRDVGKVLRYRHRSFNTHHFICIQRDFIMTPEEAGAIDVGVKLPDVAVR